MWSALYFRKYPEWRGRIATRVREANQETIAIVCIRNDKNSDYDSNDGNREKGKNYAQEV